MYCLIVQVNIIIVLGHERLYSDMDRLYNDNNDVTVLKLLKSGGVSILVKYHVVTMIILQLYSSHFELGR
jgi:hypothetical protein